MFPVPRNFICFPCSPEIIVILLFPHILEGSKQTALLVYVPANSKTNAPYQNLVNRQFNTPALGTIEM